VGIGWRKAPTRWNQQIFDDWRDERALTLAADVVVTGAVDGGSGIEAFVDHELQPSGRSVSVSLRAGADYEWIPITGSQGKSINEIVQFLQHPPFQRDLWNVIQEISSQFDRRTGLNELMYGESEKQLRSAAEAEGAVATLGRTVLKKPVGGYDGRGQARVSRAADAAEAWRSLGSGPVLAEQFLDLELELSVLVARGPDGEIVSYAPAVNHHEAGVLDWSVWPAALPDRTVQDARDIAEAIAASMGIVGLLAVEMFLVKDGRLLVNELAPRPHNSYHHSERAASTSQFEQFVRAVCGLPLGSVDALCPAAIANLLGDLWEGGAPNVEGALTVPDVRLHLYGKTSARPGLKMGHLSAVGDTTGDAKSKVLLARDRFARR
jgi:phosphoribosylaminoimidazole carboxylase PurK protein